MTIQFIHVLVPLIYLFVYLIKLRVCFIQQRFYSIHQVGNPITRMTILKTKLKIIYLHNRNI